MSLSDEEKSLIKEEIKINLDSYKATISELRFYKWTLRLIIPAVIGSAFAAYLTIEKYVDGRIEERAEKVDHIYLAQEFSGSESWGPALVELEEFSRSIGSLDKVNDSLRDYYYGIATIILGNDFDLGPEGFVAQPLWTELQSDDNYRRMIRSDRSMHDGDLLNSLGLSTLKYRDDSEKFDTAINYFTSAIEISRGRVKAANHFSLAMIFIMKGDTPAALTHLRQCNAADPDDYPLGVDKLFISGAEAQGWAWIAQRSHVPNFIDKYKEIAATLATHTQK